MYHMVKGKCMRRATALAVIILCLALLAPFAFVTQAVLQSPLAPWVQKVSNQQHRIMVLTYPTSHEPGSGGGGAGH